MRNNYNGDNRQELYNNQYYGTGFADWQNRNNAHKVLY